MAEYRIREQESTEPELSLLWDTRWDATESLWDWVIVPLGTVGNPGGLEALRALDTAVLIQLATHRRAADTDVIDGTDRKGWWGDTIDLEAGEGPIGSRLWQLYRSALTDDTVTKAVLFAREALQPIVDQGAVVRFDIVPVVDKLRNALGLVISGYSQDGAKVYDQRFARLWGQELAVAGTSL